MSADPQKANEGSRQGELQSKGRWARVLGVPRKEAYVAKDSVAKELKEVSPRL